MNAVMHEHRHPSNLSVGLKAAATRIGLSYDEYARRIGMGLRWCSACKTWHCESEFGKSKSQPYGVAGYCKKTMREWRSSNNNVKQYQREYRKDIIFNRVGERVGNNGIEQPRWCDFCGENRPRKGWTVCMSCASCERCGKGKPEYWGLSTCGNCRDKMLAALKHPDVRKKDALKKADLRKDPAYREKHRAAGRKYWQKNKNKINKKRVEKTLKAKTRRKCAYDYCSNIIPREAKALRVYCDSKCNDRANRSVILVKNKLCSASDCSNLISPDARPSQKYCSTTCNHRQYSRNIRARA